MLHTPDGARVGLHCIWWGTAKDRKLIIKTIKEFLEKVATAEFGHILLFGTIDAVDDTVAVKKSLISGLLKQVDTLMDDKFAKKVLLSVFIAVFFALSLFIYPLLFYSQLNS